jgi:hypothetical protein
MRPVTEFLPSAWRRTQQTRTVYVGSHEDKLSRLASMHIDPDDDGRTREDVEHQRCRAPRGLRGLDAGPPPAVT